MQYNIATVNIYFEPQGHKGRTWVKPQMPNSVITCRKDLKLGGNVSPGIADKMHLTHDLTITYLFHGLDLSSIIMYYLGLDFRNFF